MMTGDTERPAFSFGPLPTESLPLRDRVRRLGLQAIARLYLRAANQGKSRSILLVRPDHLGDMLFLTPGLRLLRQALPESRITLLAGPWSSAVIGNSPDIDRLITFPFPGFERGPKAGLLAPYMALRTLASHLRDDAYDAAVILRGDHWWGAWAVAEARIPRRIGYDLPDTSAFLTQAIPYEATRHEVEQNSRLLHMLAPATFDWRLGDTSFNPAAEDEDWADRRLEDAKSAQGPLVAIPPGAGARVKQWSTSNWSSVASRLYGELHATIVLTGSVGERELTGPISAAVPGAIDLAGHTSLGQLGALFARCNLVLGPDSGPLHLAAAVGTPSITLYGPIAPAKFGPWGDPARHLVLTTDWHCAPCNRLDWDDAQAEQHACVRAITLSAVLAAATRLLADTPTHPGLAGEAAADAKEQN